MTAAAVPIDEEARLAALYAEHVLDSPAEPGFDRVVRLAAAAFGPDATACIVFVDRDRLWAKARVQFPLDHGPREGSPISHTIGHEGALWVEDVCADPRFSTSGAALEFGVRFYAGAPVRGRDRQPIGVLGVWSLRPRPFDGALAAQLEDFADVVTNELELRRGRAALQRTLDDHAEAGRLTEIMVRQAPVALAMFDLR